MAKDASLLLQGENSKPSLSNPLYTPLSKGGKGGWREVWREVFKSKLY